MTPTIAQTFAAVNTAFVQKLREACAKAPIPTQEEAQALMPEIPFEVHNTRPIDPEVCANATRAMCGWV